MCGQLFSPIWIIRHNNGMQHFDIEIENIVMDSHNKQINDHHADQTEAFRIIYTAPPKTSKFLRRKFLSTAEAIALRLYNLSLRKQ